MNRLLRALMLLVIVVALIVAGVSTALTNAVTQPIQTNGDETGAETEEIEFIIEPGETLSQVANKLRANNLIRYPLLFRLMVSQQGLGQSLQAGTYKLRQGMSMSEIMAVLQNAPPPDQVEFTIIPGWRMEQVAEMLVERGLIDDPEAFLKLARDAKPFKERHSRLESIPEGQGLEGYLFPDTYQIEKTAAVEDIIDKILTDGFDANYQTFEQEITAETGDGSAPSVHELVTMASIVQREAANDEEMAHLAYIFWNRLKPENADEVDGRIQADPTLQYALGKHGDWWPKLDKLSLDEINNHPSPYNTRRIKGLPPGPIANPGLKALRAAARPGAQRPNGSDGANDLYFVKKCGEKAHDFAATYAEFEPLQQALQDCPDK